jgi:hypothetical protein
MGHQKSEKHTVIIFLSVILSSIFALSFFNISVLNAQTSSHSITVTAIVAATSTPETSTSHGGGGGGSSKTEPVGDKQVIFKGIAVPNGIVTILYDGTIKAEGVVNPNGSFTISVTNIPEGTHNFAIREQDSKGNISTIQTYTVKISAGVTTTIDNIVLPTDLTQVNTVLGEHDLNTDDKVNIIDFSIMAYWYNRKNPPKSVDFNHDGVFNLADFSILAYYWTG